MANAKVNKVVWAAAAVVATMFIYQGTVASKSLRAKVQEQTEQTETVVRWKQSYKALAATRAKWDQSFQRSDAIQDLVGLAEHLGLKRYGLETDRDNMHLLKIEQVQQNNLPIGLTKFCLATGSGSGSNFLVAAENYERLLTGVDRLAKRPDISLGTISLEGDKAFPIAKLGEFCVLLRNG
jgi:hypothetical protein